MISGVVRAGSHSGALNHWFRFAGPPLGLIINIHSAHTFCDQPAALIVHCQLHQQAESDAVRTVYKFTFWWFGWS